MYWQWYKEKEEKSVISSSDTIIHPRTMVIECLQGKKFELYSALPKAYVRRKLTSIQWLHTEQCEHRGGR